MRVAKQCLDYSIALIKINFAFILVLQALKLFTGMTDAIQQTNNSNNNQSLVITTTTSDTNTSSSFLDYLGYVARLWTSNTYDINLMEASKTEIVNVYDRVPTTNNENNTDFDLVYSALEDNPAANNSTNDGFVTFKSFVNFTQLIQYNNLKNMVKLVFVLNLNLTTLIANLIVVSFLIIKNNTKNKKRSACFKIAGWRFGPKFLRSHLVLNLVLLIVLLAVNTLYLFIFNDYFKVTMIIREI